MDEQPARQTHEQQEATEHSQAAQQATAEVQERWRRLNEILAEAEARGERFERIEEEEAEVEAVRGRWNLLKDRWEAKHGTPPSS